MNGEIDIIRVEYSAYDLGGVSENDFVAELHDALKATFGQGFLIDIARTGSNKRWGMRADGTEIEVDEIRNVIERVFEKLNATIAD